MRWRYNRTHRSRKKKHQQRMSLQSLPLQKRTLKKSSITSPKFSPVSATTTAMGTLGVMHLGMARVVSFSADLPQHPPPVFLAHFVGDACVRERFARLPKGRIRRLAANIAKLPLNIDQTAKSKSNAHDKGGTNEDSSRRNGACEFPTRCLFGRTRTAGSGGAARRKRSKRRSGSDRPDGSKRRSGSARADGTKRRPGSARAGGFRRQRRHTDRERRKNSQLQ